MKILSVYRQDTAVGYYRQRVPGRILKSLGHDIEVAGPYGELRPDNIKLLDSESLKPVPSGARKIVAFFMERLEQGIELFIHDRCTDSEEQENYADFRHYSPGCKMICDFDDDFMNVPTWNPAKRLYYPGKSAYETGLYELKLAEMVTVSTRELQEAYAGYSHRIHVAPNYIDPQEWEGWPVDPCRAGDDCIRILYGGASGHYGDMDEAKEGLQEVLLNPPVPIRLITMGAVPKWIHDIKRTCPEAAARVITLPWVIFADYPAAVAWGGFDIAIAPLASHPFNDAKSWIKWEEAAIQKIAFLGSNVGPYVPIPDDCAVKTDNTPQAWKENLTELILNADLRRRLTEKSYELVRETCLPAHGAKVWDNILSELSSAPRINSLEDTWLPGEAHLSFLDPSEKRDLSLEQGGPDNAHGSHD